ncbi:hypothetical protein [Polaromonas sp.]|uniref:hypothetical protein n=1 Tax=Polaromonas sp. TaxID=1869339 RepID=UPI003262FAD9
MTRTVLFANAQANGISVGQRSSSSPSVVRQVLDAADAMLTTLAAAHVARLSPPWMTPSIRRNMSARSQRLMRADY